MSVSHCYHIVPTALRAPSVALGCRTLTGRNATNGFWAVAAPVRGTTEAPPMIVGYVVDRWRRLGPTPFQAFDLSLGGEATMR